jgi:hypothetical protein
MVPVIHAVVPCHLVTRGDEERRERHADDNEPPPAATHDSTVQRLVADGGLARERGADGSAHTRQAVGER